MWNNLQLLTLFFVYIEKDIQKKFNSVSVLLSENFSSNSLEKVDYFRHTKADFTKLIERSTSIKTEVSTENDVLSNSKKFILVKLKKLFRKLFHFPMKRLHNCIRGNKEKGLNFYFWLRDQLWSLASRLNVYFNFAVKIIENVVLLHGATNGFRMKRNAKV